MRNILKLLSLILISGLLLSGCANFSPDWLAPVGMGMKDLEKARETGKTKTFSIPYDEAFDRVVAIMKKRDLGYLRISRKRGYIVAIGFPKQTSTTRVGIFFESIDADTTKITLSSLSTSALAKAEFMIFGSITDTTVID